MYCAICQYLSTSKKQYNTHVWSAEHQEKCVEIVVEAKQANYLQERLRALEQGMREANPAAQEEKSAKTVKLSYKR